MNDANAVPWAGLAIVATTVVALLGLAFLLNLMVQCVVGARDALRDRYVGGGWSPRTVDFLGAPIWIGLEVVCLIGALVLAVLTVMAIYSLARDFRDWWHEGDRGR